MDLFLNTRLNMTETHQLFKQLDLLRSCLPEETIAVIRLLDEMGIKPTAIGPGMVAVYRSYAAVDAELRRRGVLK